MTPNITTVKESSSDLMSSREALVWPYVAVSTSAAPLDATVEKMMIRLPFAAMFVPLLLAASCSNAGNSTGDAVAETSPSTTGIGATDLTSTSVHDQTPQPLSGDAIDAWIAMWDGAELVVTDPTAAETGLGAVAVPAVAERLTTIFAPSVAGDVDVAARTFVNHPVLTENDDGTVQIDDCVEVSPPDTAPFTWFGGTAALDDGTWRIVSLEPKALGGCVPSEIAEAAIAGYEAYWDARVEFWDPADPNHPLVNETLAGEQADLIRGLLADHQQQGLALRGRAQTHPEIVEITSSTSLTILDCAIQDPERGVFDTTTGERTDGIAPVQEDQRDLRSTVMVLEDDRWKVSDVQGQANVRCDIAPTVQGIPAV